MLKKEKVFEKMGDSPSSYLVYLPKKTDDVYVAVTVLGGFAAENKKTYGAMHLLEHYILGETSLNSESKLDINGRVRLECTEFYMASNQQKLSGDLKQFLESIFSSSFDKEDVLNPERKAALLEIGENENQQRTMVYELSDNLILGDNCSYAGRYKEEASNIEKFTLEELKDIYASSFVSGNIAITIGAYKPSSNLIEEVKDIISGIEITAGPKVDFPTCEPLLGAVKTANVNGLVGVYTTFMFPGVSLKAGIAEKIGTNILSRLLVGWSESGMSQKMRGVGVSHFSRTNLMHQNFGTISFTANASEEEVKEVIEVFLKGLEELREKGITVEDLKRECDNMKKRAVQDWDANGARFDWVRDDIAELGRVITPGDIERTIDTEVDLEFINSLAKRLFSRENMSLAVVGDGVSDLDIVLE